LPDYTTMTKKITDSVIEVSCDSVHLDAVQADFENNEFEDLLAVYEDTQTEELRLLVDLSQFQSDKNIRYIH
jgi:hypothetical protein